MAWYVSTAIASLCELLINAVITNKPKMLGVEIREA